MALFWVISHGMTHKYVGKFYWCLVFTDLGGSAGVKVSCSLQFMFDFFFREAVFPRICCPGVVMSFILPLLMENVLFHPGSNMLKI